MVLEDIVKKRICVMILACATFLCACGSKVTEDTDGNFATAISIKKDGSIEDRITEEFSEEYYDVTELESMINESISEYLKDEPQSQITLKKCRQEDNNAVVEMKYNDYNAYARFNGEKFFAGTIKEAYEAGYDLNITLNSVNSDSETASAISKQELLNMGDNHIVILERIKINEEIQEQEPLHINCFGEILYASEGISASNKKTARVDMSEGLAVIVFK